MDISAISSKDDAQLNFIHDSKIASDLKSATFENMLVDGLTEMNDAALKSEKNLSIVSSGDISKVHDSIVEIEKAKRIFSLSLQIRNKLLEAYQEVLRMQI